MSYTDIENEKGALRQLREILERVPFLRNIQSFEEPRYVGRGLQPDFVLELEVGDQPWTLICEIKSNGQPRFARMAAYQLKDCIAESQVQRAYPVLIAPFISETSAEICRKADVGFLDFAGNCYLSFGNIFIERKGEKTVSVEKRQHRSLFSPKSSRILKLMLRDPGRCWKVEELAEKADVSLGQVSNVRNALLDREWGNVEEAGVHLVQPDMILDAWRNSYIKRSVKRSSYYSLLHGKSFEDEVRNAFESNQNKTRAVFASYSAAQWLAPFARVGSHYFYADEEGEHLLQNHLSLEPISKGENVIVERPKDRDVLVDSIEPASGIWCTGLIQTYLDLANSGERGLEAAEHLRSQIIEPLWRDYL